MKAEIATLCEFASVRENLVHIVAGGITQILLPIPAVARLYFALATTAPSDEPVGTGHVLEISIVAPDGDEIHLARGHFEVAAEPDIPELPRVFQLALPVAFPVRMSGLHTVVVRGDDEELARLPLMVFENVDESGETPRVGGETA